MILFKKKNISIFQVYNGVALLGVKFDPRNANLYGTKLMNHLFTMEEMATGYIESSIGLRDSELKPERMNIL